MCVDIRMQPQQQQQAVLTSTGVQIQPQYIIQPYQTASVVSAYRHRQSTVVGILLIIVGCFSIVFNVVDLAVGSTGYRHHYYYYSYSYYERSLSYKSNGVSGHGIWCGAMVSIKAVLLRISC